MREKYKGNGENPQKSSRKTDKIIARAAPKY
jgi:hypothetical protein